MTGVDKLANAIEQHDLRVKRVIAGQFLYHRAVATDFAKTNAPWTDRTANARAGLHSKVETSNDNTTFDLIVAHTVYYGLWLEVRFSGKFGIIMPTVNYVGSLMLDRIASSIQRLEVS